MEPMPRTETTKIVNSSYGTGKRKTSIARLWLRKGSGSFKVNGKFMQDYFTRESYKLDILKPLEVAEMQGQLDFNCTVQGGGLSGQVGAIRHALSRAIDALHPAKRKALRQNGLLTRDSRIVERKKYGKRKARKSTQFSKR